MGTRVRLSCLGLFCVHTRWLRKLCCKSSRCAHQAVPYYIASHWRTCKLLSTLVTVSTSAYACSVSGGVGDPGATSPSHPSLGLTHSPTRRMADLQAYRAVLAVGPTVPPKWTDSLPDTRSPSLLSSVYETEGGTKAPPVKATAPDTGPFRASRPVVWVPLVATLEQLVEPTFVGIHATPCSLPHASTLLRPPARPSHCAALESCAL